MKYNNGRLSFWYSNEEVSFRFSKETFSKVEEVWKKENAICEMHGKLKDEYKKLNGEEFVTIPYKVTKYFSDFLDKKE